MLVLAVGLASRTYVGQLKGLKEYGEEDFEVLQHAVQNAVKIVTTPNIITETSNLIGRFDPHVRTAVYAKLAVFLQRVEVDEQYVFSRTASVHPHFHRLGLTDIAVTIVSRDAVLWTNDLHLYLFATQERIEVKMFNHLPHRNKYMIG